jgi:hypothetical protein
MKSGGQALVGGFCSVDRITDRRPQERLNKALYLYWRLLVTHLVDVGTAIATGILGIVVFVPIVVGAKEVAGRLDRWLG